MVQQIENAIYIKNDLESCKRIKIVLFIKESDFFAARANLLLDNLLAADQLIQNQPAERKYFMLLVTQCKSPEEKISTYQKILREHRDALPADNKLRCALLNYLISENSHICQFFQPKSTQQKTYEFDGQNIESIKRELEVLGELEAPTANYPISFDKQADLRLQINYSNEIIK